MSYLVQCCLLSGTGNIPSISDVRSRGLLEEQTNDISGGTQTSMIADGLREFIETNQHDYVRMSDECFRMRFGGKHGEYTMFAHAVEEPGQVMVFTYCPVKVPEERRGLAADYINRVNYGLVIGCLEMDPTDGEVRSRSTAPVAQDDPGPRVFSPLFDSSYYLIENWLPGLLRVAFGAEDPATAYATALDALRSDQPAVDEPDTGAAEADSVRELSAIEQEVARLLAEADGAAESPPQSHIEHDG
jgi:hypothetical protein